MREIAGNTSFTTTNNFTLIFDTLTQFSTTTLTISTMITNEDRLNYDELAHLLDKNNPDRTLLKQLMDDYVTSGQ